MDKASKAIRRGSVRLKAIGSGHRELNMVISELKGARCAAKVFASAQHTAMQELIRWAVSEKNQSLRNTFVLLSELADLWSQVQKEFTDNLKDFIYQFEMVLEGEYKIDETRNYVTSCEQKEMKIKKELKKLSSKSPNDSINKLETKLKDAQQSKDVAQLEMIEQVKENEAVKMIRVKSGLLKVSDAYLQMARKCFVIHEAYYDVASQVPDVDDKDIYKVKHTGFREASAAVNRAKEKINIRPCRPHSSISPSLPRTPPPPYSPPAQSSSCPQPPYNPDFSRLSSMAANSSPDDYLSPVSRFSSSVHVAPSRQHNSSSSS
ncbi:uncharacterized protein LOC134529287 isoform X2 [Bacillus rossius redtenbacheri]|uniref:uncharacterized protein LOC134529287 isoform X2 n=1 Tax=Bacillus rossius redtenbacheri TaxID=93214 RepID=UPI002FDCDE2A